MVLATWRQKQEAHSLRPALGYPIQKITKAKRVGDVTQVVEQICLVNMRPFSIFPVSQKRKKKLLIYLPDWPAQPTHAVCLTVMST
jgi:hypothetical protein